MRARPHPDTGSSLEQIPIDNACDHVADIPDPHRAVCTPRQQVVGWVSPQGVTHHERATILSLQEQSHVVFSTKPTLGPGVQLLG